MSDIFGGLMKGLSSIITQENTDMKIYNIQCEIKELNDKEDKIFSSIGRKLYKPEEHANYAPQLELISKNKEDLQNQLALLEKEKQDAEEALAAQEAENLECCCTECGAFNEKGKNFCQECGAKLEVAQFKFFGNCGAKVSANKKFCGECGNEM